MSYCAPSYTCCPVFAPKIVKQKILPNNGNVVFPISLVSVLWSWLCVLIFLSKFGKSIFIWHCLLQTTDFSSLNFIFLWISVYYNAGNNAESWIEALYLMSTKQLKSCVTLMCWRPPRNALFHAEAFPQISPTERHSACYFFTDLVFSS